MTEYSWITFKVSLAQLPWQSWVKLGECTAKCEQIRGIPISPALREQLRQIYLAKDYIYEQFAAHRTSNTIKRRRDLAIKISEHSAPIDKDSLLILMRNEYRDKTERTFARDINELEKIRLVVRKKGGYVANKELMLQFLPFST